MACSNCCPSRGRDSRTLPTTRRQAWLLPDPVFIYLTYKLLLSMLGPLSCRLAGHLLSPLQRQDSAFLEFLSIYSLGSTTSPHTWDSMSPGQSTVGWPCQGRQRRKTKCQSASVSQPVSEKCFGYTRTGKGWKWRGDRRCSHRFDPGCASELQIRCSGATQVPDTEHAQGKLCPSLSWPPDK